MSARADPRGSALARLACAEIDSAATIEAAARACVALVGDVIAGRPCQLDAVELHAGLERVLDAEARGSRALSAQLAAAAALQRLDDHLEPPEAASEPKRAPEPDDELDPFSKLDLQTDTGIYDPGDDLARRRRFGA